jgi:hypothetical protein
VSDELAIASVTTVLKNLIENGLIDRHVTGSIGSDVTVTALPPDRITTGADERAQLNLFFYQATPNTALRPSTLPSSEDRAAALPNGGLSLDLHYLVTAYGARDLQAEVLMGYVMSLFQSTPVVTREPIRKALASAAGNGSQAAVAGAAADLAARLNEIRIRPQFLNTEEMSKLWSALQSRFRPSTAYKVSLVMLDGRR